MRDLKDKEAQSRSLVDWLCYIEQLHPANIELGLERVTKVAEMASLNDLACNDMLEPCSKPIVITVAGTNGKGTTCAIIEQILLQQGLKVGVYSSPHIHDYRERVRLNGQLASEQAFCARFVELEALRQSLNIELTYFEFGTLAAVSLLKNSALDVILLEVGLGGRLDATNVFEPNISVVTTVDLDHSEWLGNSREQVGYEKAGIFRPHKPAICGDLQPPKSLITHAETLGSQLYLATEDFSVSPSKDGHFDWQWHGKELASDLLSVTHIPDLGHVPKMNIATALATIAQLPLKFSSKEINKAIANTRLAGRMQQVNDIPLVLTDVAHNPQATTYLAKQLLEIKQKTTKTKVYAVVGMLADKDSQASLAPMLNLVDKWFLCDLQGPRAAKAAVLEAALKVHHCHNEIASFSSVAKAMEAALDYAEVDDIIFAFGSFYTVSDVLTFFNIESVT